MSALAALDGLETSDRMAQGLAAFQANDFAAAISHFQTRVMQAPGDYEARYWLASSAAAAGATEEAAGILSDARTVHAQAVMVAGGVDVARLRTDRAYAYQIGNTCYAQKYMAAASDCFGRALDFDNLDPTLMLSYGLSLQHQGRIQEAVDVFTAASEVFSIPSVHQFLLYPLFCVEDRMARVSAASRHWGELYAPPPSVAPAPFANARSADRRLRIGYVGPSFTRNQVAPSTRRTIPRPCRSSSTPPTPPPRDRFPTAAPCARSATSATRTWPP
jgi:protein O-GlcNAc transferase